MAAQMKMESVEDAMLIPEVNDGASDEGYSTGRQASPEHAAFLDQTDSSRNSAAGVSHASNRSSTVTPGIQRLGESSRELVRTINALSALGIEREIKSLPRIAVVGNQSAGKSSLIEAISEIKVPRYAGTCTRCPLEISITSNDAAEQGWKCQVFLNTQYAYDPSNVTPDNHVGVKEASIGPWVPVSPSELLFMEFKDKALMEDALIRAQAAILSPSKDPSTFLPDAGLSIHDIRRAKASETKFSPNVVHLKISGPDLPNLSFIDLPGIIETPENDNEKYLVDLIKRLVRIYLLNENCLVLLAIPMSGDPVNNSAFSIARQYAEDRTIGALTKPDMLQPGEYEQWTEVLEGKTFKVQHQYFVTKQPSQESLNRGIDHATARKEEAVFFASKAPWSTEFRRFSSRFGTAALQKFLSEQLCDLIKKKLPEIHHQIDTRLSNVRADLGRLPEPVTDRLPYELGRKFDHFQADLAAHLQGRDALDSRLANFFTAWQSESQQFYHRLGDVSPKVGGDGFLAPQEHNRSSVEPSTPSKATRNVITLDDEDDIYMSPSHAGQKRKRMETPVTPSKKRIGPTPRQEAQSLTKIFTLKEIRNISEKASVARLAGPAPAKAIEEMIRMSFSKWDTLFDRYYNTTCKQLNDHIRGLFELYFEQYAGTLLVDECLNKISAFVFKQAQEQKSRISVCLDLEKTQIFCFDRTQLDKYQREAYDVLVEMRKKFRLQKENERRDALGGKQPKARPEELPPDSWNTELESLARVQAYYAMTKSRLAVNISQRISVHLFSLIQSDLVEFLQQSLGIDAGSANPAANLAKCRILVQRDADIEDLRKDLSNRLRILQEAKHALEAYDGSSVHDSGLFL